MPENLPAVENVNQLAAHKKKRLPAEDKDKEEENSHAES